MKKIAVIASGWHFPLHFYKTLAKQFIPEGWEVDLFCIAHREPEHAEKDVKKFLKTIKGKKDRRNILDRRLYKKTATREEIEKLGWKFHLEPNTIGDWGNSNQWLEKYNYKDYDLFLFTHDDNMILNYQLFHNVITGEEYNKWLILANSQGMPPGTIRGSFEFFKREMLDIMGGKFDLSDTKLTREGQTDNPEKWEALYDWNSTIYPLARLIESKGLKDKVVAMSPCYRVSMYCIEGERGFISNTHGLNTAQEEHGLDLLQHYKII